MEGDVRESGADSGKGGEVIPIEAGKSARVKPKEKGKKGPSKMELVALYCDVLSRAPYIGDSLPPMDRTFHVMEDPTGVRTIFEELSGEVLAQRNDSAMEDLVIDYSRKLPPGSEATPTLAREITRTWKAMQRPIAEGEISPVRELSEKGKCWHRLPWDLTPGATPTFDELMGRTTNAKALMAFIGSLLVADADRQQYVWIWGEGRNGKGSLAQFLKRTLGPSYRAEVVPKTSSSNFWTAGLLGARLVVFGDCKEYRFPTSGLFKSLTGGDSVRVERKGKDPVTMDLCCKFLFLSNDKPAITSSIADKRRAIYCEMAELPEGTEVLSTAAYGARLDGEGATFLWACREAYRAIAGEHCPIPVDEKALEDVIAASEEQYEEMFASLFEPKENGEQDNEAGVDRGAMTRIIATLFNYRNGPSQKAFKDFMERRGHRLEYLGRSCGKAVRRYRGIIWKGEVLSGYGQVIRGALGAGIAAGGSGAEYDVDQRM